MKPAFLFALFSLSSAHAYAAQHFLVVSDIHFNPLANPKLAVQLEASEPSQWEAIFAADPQSPIQKYNSDSDWSLFSALVSGVQNLEAKPGLMVVTGDVLAHKFQEQFESATAHSDQAAFRSFVKKTFAFIGLELQKANGGAPIVYTTGNNDQECGDYALQPDGPFLHDTSDTVQTLAQVDSAAMAQWASLGSYVKANPLAHHHRILAVNSNYWSRRYVNSCADKINPGPDPGESELNWLADQLKMAQANGDKVWLCYHIPPGIDGYASSKSAQVTAMWKPKYAEQFNQLLDEYRNTIQLNLAGHTHLDDIRLVKTDHANTLVLINPGLSPNIGQDPAFRDYALDSKGRITDIVTYYMPDLGMKWQLEYNTRSTYGLPKIDSKSYAALYKQIEASSAVGGKWKLYYSVSRPGILGDDKAYLRSLYCATGNASADSYQACVKSKPN